MINPSIAQYLANIMTVASFDLKRGINQEINPRLPNEIHVQAMQSAKHPSPTQNGEILNPV